MRKFIVPGPKEGSLSVIASYHKPGDAVCEAPESFTNEMDPFIHIIESVGPSGDVEYSPKLDPAYFEWLKDKNEKIKDLGRIQHVSLTKAIQSRKTKIFHNQLNPAQRFVYSILGPLTHYAQNPILKKIIQLVFSGKLELYGKNL